MHPVERRLPIRATCHDQSNLRLSARKQKTEGEGKRRLAEKTAGKGSEWKTVRVKRDNSESTATGLAAIRSLISSGRHGFAHLLAMQRRFIAVAR